MRLIVTSDLHYDSRGDLTSPGQVEALAREIAAQEPDAVLLAGDMAHGLREFEACVACFRGVGAPVGVIAGNHDLWRDNQQRVDSTSLWAGELAAASVRAGARWLEEETLRVDGVDIIASVAWYDYSAADPGVRASPEDFASQKRFHNNDAVWLDWPWTDTAFASSRRASLRRRVAASEQDPGARAIVVVTHVPIVEEQMERRPHDPRWSFSNAYFGHLTAGEELVSAPKLRAIISGHSHFGKRATRARPGLAPLSIRVVAADYGAPAYEILDL